MSPVDVVFRQTQNASSAAPAFLGALDILVDGINITARAGQIQGLSLLAELAHALAALRRGRSTRATAHLCRDGEIWELGLEMDGAELLLSVFRSGTCPEVAVHERRVSMAELHTALEDALEQTLSSALPTGHRSILEGALAQLSTGRRSAKPVARGMTQDRILVRSQDGFEIVASAAFRLGSAQPSDADARVERSDLHALLATGGLSLKWGARRCELKNVHVFLMAERLLWLAEDAFESWQAARPLFRRLTIEGVRFAMRRGPGDAPVSLTVSQEQTMAVTPGAVSAQSRGTHVQLADLATIDFVETVAQLAEAICERFAFHDQRQKSNLRLTVLAENARLLRDRLGELRSDDALTNGERESYKSYGLPAVAAQTDGTWSRSGALKFAPRWVAAVPHIDLKSTFLYQEQFIVGSAREIASISPQSGSIIWRAQSERAATIPTPLGLVRLHSDGRLRLHDYGDGKVRWITKLMPRAGGGAAGALVNTPGLPALMLIAEGDRAVTAVDLLSGEVRWRHSASRPAQLRLRRAGRLVLMSGGDSALTALDVTTGEVVWRVRDRLPFSGDIAVRGDSAYALSSSSVGAARLHHIDLWSGITHGSAYIDDQPLFGQAPLLTDQHVVVPVRDRRGTGLLAFEQGSLAPSWEHEPGFVSAGSSLLAMHDSLIINSTSGTLLCVEVNTGYVRYNHVFSRPVDSDQPRRLDPILQNGALFVPQHNVQVLRPSTGELIGEVPCDLIPDLMKVDASCNVFVAEESGHLAAYSAAPRLQLVAAR
jgi:outer membrane protein assembly factor BamB